MASTNTFDNYMLASEASEFPAVRRKALVLHSFGMEGKCIFLTLSPTTGVLVTVCPTACCIYGKQYYVIGYFQRPFDDRTRAGGLKWRILRSRRTAVELPSNHYKDTCNVIVARRVFRRRSQRSVESVERPVATLRSLVLSRNCLDL